MTMKKKAAILTLRLHSNFGYLMQVYAMQKVIDSFGYNSETINMRMKNINLWGKLKYVIYRCLKGQSIFKVLQQVRDLPNSQQFNFINRHTWDFINSNIKLTQSISKIKNLHLLNNKYDIFIVGSDQVWRKEYSINLPSYYFDFLDEGVRRFAYAASFGIDYNNYSKRMTHICKNLLQKFDGVGIREKEGCVLCEKEFNVKATHVLDPTLLLEKEEYISLIDMNKVNKLI